LLALALTLVNSRHAQAASPVTNVAEVVAIQGTVEVARAGQTVWDPASPELSYRGLNPGDQIRTKERSRATIRLSDLTVVELGANSHFELLPVREQQGGFGILRGLLYLFHRDKPGEFYFRTPTASPVIRGTEFYLEVAEDGATTLNLFEGEVALTNDSGQLVLKSGEAARVQPGRPPSRTAVLDAVNVIQWCLYYPAVLYADELDLSAEEQNVLAQSLAAYRGGDLLAALASYPAGRQPGSNRERIYLAQLLLAVGQASEAEALIKSMSEPDERATSFENALRTLIAAVKFQSIDVAGTPALASSLLAQSYYHQSRFELQTALMSARAAVERAPNFAFAWARLAELEFSFGRNTRASEALDRALELAPRHAQALAVKGFILAGENRIRPALEQFDAAIAIDGALANAWLGRGLCRIRQGDTRAGVADLVVAAALEPNRSLLRSYLGKGFHITGAEVRAEQELDRAKNLDANDPTPWLYSALLNQQRNQLNDAIRDLERSEELNDNRRLYRSRLLLDQDRAVRQANLAAIYQDAGLFDQSVREASHAVSADYANYSAHLFLANSYSQRRDFQSGTALRYETVALSEYLVAQLLSPVGGSALSSYVSQQEYSRLLERQGFGVSSAAEYLSRGDWQQRGVQYGAFGNFDYALDAYYASQNGQRPNNDLDLLSLSVAARAQLTPQDTFFVQAVRTEFESGDLRQYYEPTTFDPSLRINELQAPNLFAGYHHEWGPGSHTLLLAGWLNDDFRATATNVYFTTLRRNPEDGHFYTVVPLPFTLFDYAQHADFTAFSGELQQIWGGANNTLVLGARYQDGETESDANLQKLPPVVFGDYPADTQHFRTHLRRAVAYLYDHWKIVDVLWLIGGVSYDWLSFPENIDIPPITAEEKHKDQISPKAGLIWLPAADVVFRGAYTRSLGGLYFDNSVRLEPAQVAGFNQAFRALIPESLAGLAPGAEFETVNLDLSWRLPTSTYLGAGVERLWSQAERSVGVFDSTDFDPVQRLNTPQQLEFEERSLICNFNQLIGRDWSLGVRYRVSHAELDQRLPAVIANLSPNTLPSDIPGAVQNDAALLHQLNLSVNYAHPCGFFSEAQALWYAQDSRNLPDSDFWQINVFGGYRFADRRVEVLVGGLNLTDQNYRLNPINLHNELPRKRTLLVSWRFNF
jgi:Tfp pilus assembly protein PilF